MLSLSVNTNNQVTNTGFSYDASGDVTNDGVYTYAWNAEQHLKSAASVTYTYDGDLRRVEKSSGTLYWYTPAGVPLAETDTSGNTLNEYVFFGSARVARRDSSGNVYYYFEDHLGTATTLSNASGVLCYDADFLPFGYERAYVTSCAQNYKFTGLERDGETGLDHTLNRKYDSTLGRWLTPDPKRGDTSDPQSLNRYAYVLDNPLAMSDPVGLFAPNPCWVDPALCFPSPVGLGGSGGGASGEGGGPCSNIVMAGGHRPHLTPCGSGSAGGGSACSKKDLNFFNLMVPFANSLAKTWNCNPNFILALAAFESGWDPIYSGPTHPQPINNPFGVTNGGGPDQTYPSLQAAVNYWSSHFGQYIQGVTTMQQFAEDLQPHYNTSNPDWITDLVKVYPSVLTRRKACGQ
jgi:RHS repeat-associated protein